MASIVKNGVTVVQKTSLEYQETNIYIKINVILEVKKYQILNNLTPD